MSKVYYGNPAKRLIPAPLVSISKEYLKSGDGNIIGKIYNIVLTGTIVAWMGSPTSSGTFWETTGYPPDESIGANSRLSAIQRKQEAIRDLFSTEGLHFEIQALDGTSPVKCNPRINSINFAEGIWYDRCEYTINLEADELYGGSFAEEDTFSEYISDASEDWSIDTQDTSPESETIPRTYTFTHNVSAVGKRFYLDDGTGTVQKPAWQQARTYVLSRLGFDSAMALSSGVNNLPSYYNGFNHVRNEQIDENGGRYSVTESWVLASGTATESFSISTGASLDGQYTDVSIEGEINGYEVRDSSMNLTTSKWTNANTKFTYASGLALTRAQQFSGITLNVLPIRTNIGRNPIMGTINYTYEYNNRPITMVSGAKSEQITVSDNVGGQSYATIFVLGRAAGPVLQDLGTKQANTRNLNMELIFDAPSYTERSVTTLRNILVNNMPHKNPTYSGSIQNIIDAVNPANGGFTTVFQDQPQITWDAKEGRTSINYTWVYE